jgi:hypothetical protein
VVTATLDTIETLVAAGKIDEARIDQSLTRLDRLSS